MKYHHSTPFRFTEKAKAFYTRTYELNLMEFGEDVADALRNTEDILEILKRDPGTHITLDDLGVYVSNPEALGFVDEPDFDENWNADPLLKFLVEFGILERVPISQLLESQEVVILELPVEDGKDWKREVLNQLPDIQDIKYEIQDIDYLLPHGKTIDPYKTNGIVEIAVKVIGAPEDLAEFAQQFMEYSASDDINDQNSYLLGFIRGLKPHHND